MLCNVLWQGEPTTVLIREQGVDVEVTGTPVVVSYWFGVTPGLFLSRDGQFGWWYSSNVTDVMTAYRVARLIPLATRLRETSGYEQTLCSLVIGLRGDDNIKRREWLADDFGVTLDELNAMINGARQTGPSDTELETILEQLGTMLNERGGILSTHLTCVEKAEAAGIIRFTPRSLELVEAAQDRRRADEQQMAHDEQEILEPVDPEQSIMRLLIDLGVRHLAYPFFEDWAPSHVELGTFDHFVKKYCIGRSGYYRSIKLIVTQKGPDDPTAHSAVGTADGSFTMFSSNFGEATPVVGDIGNQRLILHSVRYERGGTYWVSVSRRDLPSDMDLEERKDAVEISVPDLRELVWSLLPPGTELAMSQAVDSSVIATPIKGIRRLLHRDN